MTDISTNMLEGTTSDGIVAGLKRKASDRNLNLEITAVQIGDFKAALVTGFKLGGITIEDGVALYFPTQQGVLVIIGYDSPAERAVIASLHKSDTLAN